MYQRSIISMILFPSLLLLFFFLFLLFFAGSFIGNCVTAFALFVDELPHSNTRESTGLKFVTSTSTKVDFFLLFEWHRFALIFGLDFLFSAPFFLWQITEIIFPVLDLFPINSFEERMIANV